MFLKLLNHGLTNSNYPIDHPQKIIDTFADALTQIYAVSEIKDKTATNEEYTTIYNKIMLNPIFDSHPIMIYLAGEPSRIS